MIGRLSCLLALALFFGPAIAEAQLLEDDFSDGDYSGWTVVDDPEPQSGPSQWSVIDGMLVQSSNIWSYGPVELETKYHQGTHVFRGESAWTDYTFNAILRSTDNDGIGLLFRYQDAGSYYRLLLMNDSAWSGNDINGSPVNTPLQRLQKFDKGEPITLAENLVSEAYPTGYFAVTVQAKSDTLRAWLNGSMILEATDPDYVQGKVGLMSYANTGAHFDDILIEEEHTVYDTPSREVTYAVREDRMPYVQRPTQESIEIAWRTVVPAMGSVRIGSEKGNLDREIKESEARQKHHVVVDNLDASSRYYYQVFNDGQLMADEESFRTARRNEESRFSFLVIGDSGVNTETQWNIAREMEASHNRDEVDFLVHVGDVHQGSGDYYDDVYFKPYGPLIRQMNTFTSLGNHDTYTDGGAVYLDDFYLPDNNPEQTERYYSFRWGNAFFIALDTNINYAPGSAQYDFLVSQLNAPERREATWTFVYAHHPPWTEYWTGYYGDEQVRAHLVPLFEEHGVDMVMNGHTHSYERGERGHVHYLVSGGGGGGLDSFFVDYGHITFSAGVHHFTRIDIDGEEMWVTATDENGDEVDRFLINKQVSLDAQGGFPEVGDRSVEISAPFPNPADRLTRIQYRIPDTRRVRIQLFDMQGRQVSHLVDRVHSIGIYEVEVSTSHLPAGQYALRIAAEEFLETRIITVIE